MAEKKSAKKSAKAPAKVKAKKPEKVEEIKKVDEAEKPKESKEQNTKNNQKKSKKGLFIGLAAVLVAGIAGIVVALVCNFGANNSADVTAKLSYTNAFFIYDKKYTLWNADGKRLTEDEYTDTSSFVGGYAYVKKDDQAGVVREDGTMSVAFGKYGSISNRGGLYLAQDGNTKEYQLITGAGAVLAKGSELKTFAATYAAGAAAVITEGKVKLYNFAGKLITETAEADDAKEPALNTSSDFGVMYYAGKNFVFDARNGNLIASFEDERYSFEEVSEDRRLILLENYSDSDKYKLLADGKIYDLNEYKHYTFTPLDHVIGYDTTSKIALLDKEFKTVAVVSSYVELKDSYNYAVEADNGVEIYRNGEKVKDFAGAEISHSGYFYEDFYAIEDENKAMFYTLDGAVGINHEYKRIKTLFDEHHHAVVSDEENAYYLIDSKGNQISDFTAKYISSRNGGYEIENADGKCAVANKAGKLISEFKYDDTYYRSYAEPHNIWTGENGRNSYDVIDGETGKVIAADVNVSDFSTNYFVAKNSEGKKVYYTYAGEKFYTES